MKKPGTLILSITILVLSLGFLVSQFFSPHAANAQTKLAILDPDSSIFFPPSQPDSTGTSTDPSTTTDSTTTATNPELEFTLEGRPEPKQLSAFLAGDTILLTIWKTVLALTNIVVAGYLIVIAFATLLHVSVDTYHIKKTIVPLILGIVLANFSLFITRLLIDLAQTLGKVFYTAGAGGLLDPTAAAETFTKNLAEAIFIKGGQMVANSLDALNSLGGDPIKLLLNTFVPLILVGITTVYTITAPLLLVGFVIIGFIIALIPAALLLILAALLYIRTYVLLFLIAISPLAFLSITVAGTQGIFRRWWSEFLRWAFMAPAVFFLLWLVIKLANVKGHGDANVGTYLLALAMLYMAIQVPFGLGGKIMGTWGGLGKKLALPLALGGGYWLGRTLDYKLGAKSPYRLYKGWQKRSSMRYEEHAAESEAFGMGLRDASQSAMSAAVHGKGFRGKFIEPYTRFQEKMAETRQAKIQATMEQSTNTARGILDYEPARVQQLGDIKNLTRAEDEVRKRAYILAAAVRGEKYTTPGGDVSGQDYLDWLVNKGVISGNEHRALVTSAQKLSIYEKDMPLFSQKYDIQGKELSEQDQAKEYERAAANLMANTPSARRPEAAQSIVKKASEIDQQPALPPGSPLKEVARKLAAMARPYREYLNPALQGVIDKLAKATEKLTEFKPKSMIGPPIIGDLNPLITALQALNKDPTSVAAFQGLTTEAHISDLRKIELNQNVDLINNIKKTVGDEKFDQVLNTLYDFDRPLIRDGFTEAIRMIETSSGVNLRPVQEQLSRHYQGSSLESILDQHGQTINEALTMINQRLNQP